MAERKKRKPMSNEGSLVITRVFDAPRGRVWRAWTEPELIKRWWGPKYFTSPHVEIDLRVGGKYLYSMRGPDGKDYWSTGTFREIDPPERIVCTDSFADEKGNIVQAAYYGMDGDIPLELLVIITLKEREGKTEFTLHHEGFPKGQHMENARQGWNESLDKLAEVIRSMA